tara:strand:+ start:485 stop:691 length:207 start_codon:yes stop_codon:yes gene_type:complete
MDLILFNDGLYSLIPVTKAMLEHIKIMVEVDCFNLCEIIKIKFTTYVDSLNLHIMNNGSGNFYGCICK